MAPSAPRTSGSLVSYTMTATNAGPDTARDVVVEHSPDRQMRVSAISCVAAGGAQCPQSTGLRMAAPMIPSGGALTFMVYGRIASGAAGAITNAVRVLSAGADRVSDNDIATSSWGATQPRPTGSTTVMQVESDPDDPIVRGQSYSYTKANALVDATFHSERYFTVKIDGDQLWNVVVAAPQALARFEVGTYHFTHADPADAEVAWTGEGTTCNTDGWLAVDQVAYAGAELLSIDLRFEQRCVGLIWAARGRIHWVKDDATAPPPPLPVPQGLWMPADGATPATGNYLYLHSDAGDHVGMGGAYLYTQRNSQLNGGGGSSGGWLMFGARGDETWQADFQVMSSLARLQPGFYVDLRSFSANPAVGHLRLWGPGGNCDLHHSTGWVAIDRAEYTAGALTALDMRFEQRCLNASGALHGQLHWDTGDTTAPPGPEIPPPPGLWTPAPGTTPSSGNYVYLQSESGDPIGLGASYLYTPAAAVSINGFDRQLRVSIPGNAAWVGNFGAMNSIERWTPRAYYAIQPRYLMNLTRASMSWTAFHLGCIETAGWFVVDAVSFVDGSMSSIELRFEQHCNGAAQALRGAIRWTF